MADANDLNGSEVSGTEESDALTAILNEYESGGKPKTPERDTSALKILKAIEPVVRYVNDDKVQKESDARQGEIKSFMDFMSEADELKEAPARLVRGYLEASYAEDADFKAAYENRGTNPGGWTNTLTKARDALIEDFASLPGSKVRSDVEAAAAAVKGVGNDSSGDSVSANEMFNMSDTDFARFKQGLSS